MTTQTSLAPVFFISHGAPTFALEPGQLGPQLTALGRQLGSTRAVLVVSPHWQTRDVQVMTTAVPETVHDFGGFARALYELHYPAAGHPELAPTTANVLQQAGWPVSLEARRGLDHGAWVPMRHLLPSAHVPVFQVSMPHSLTTAQALALGQTLAPLRSQGVMIVASGSMTHNLQEYRPGHVPAADYAVAFTHWIRQAVGANDAQSLVDYARLAPHAQRAHPTEEHYLPLLVAMGAHTADDAFQLIDGGVTHGILSMESYAWGLSTSAGSPPA